MFDSGKPFQPSLVFSSKAGVNPSEHLSGALGQALGLTLKYKTTLDKLDYSGH